MVVSAGAALTAGLAGPLAYTLDTVNTTYTGAIPSAGPAVTGAFGGPGGGLPRRGFRGFPGGRHRHGRFPARHRRRLPRRRFPGGAAGTGTGAGTGNGTGTGRASAAGSGRRRRAGGLASAVLAWRGGGGLSGNTQVSSALVKLLEADAGKYRWIAATEGSQEAAPIELATGGLAVVAIGGFNGSDPAPTLAQFESMVAAHEIHYYVGRGAQSFGGGPGSSSIASWVAAHYTAQTVGGVTVYDLTKPS